jgi:hypothetical protein
MLSFNSVPKLHPLALLAAHLFGVLLIKFILVHSTKFMAQVHYILRKIILFSLCMESYQLKMFLSTLISFIWNFSWFVYKIVLNFMAFSPSVCSNFMCLTCVSIGINFYCMIWFKLQNHMYIWWMTLLETFPVDN